MSNYFLHIPNVWYNLDINGKRTLLDMKDIACNVRVNDYIMNTLTEYNHYKVMNDDTWDSISQKLYGVPHYHWLLMILNLTWDGNSDLPVDGDVMVKNFNASRVRQTDQPGETPNRWEEKEVPFRNGVYEYQVAVDFTDGEEFFAVNEGHYMNLLTTTTTNFTPIKHRFSRLAQEPSANIVIDDLGFISSPLDIFDSDEFVKKRPWLQSQSDIELTESAKPEFYKHVFEHKLITARDAIVARNERLSTIKVLTPSVAAVAATEIMTILKDAM